MVGQKYTSKQLNNTLLCLIKLLNKYDIKGWFICYGTLLGIVRENSCIDGDDDIDIVIDKKYYNKLKEILINNNFLIEYRYGINNNNTIIKTLISTEYASIDIYMCDIDEHGNYNDLWNKLLIKNCIDLIKKTWMDNILYLPNDYTTKLINRYGETWNIKQDKKICQTMKFI